MKHLIIPLTFAGASLVCWGVLNSTAVAAAVTGIFLLRSAEHIANKSQ